MLKSLDDDSHVKTRLCQYEAVNSDKGVYIAKQFVLGKFKGQTIILDKYGLKPHDQKYIKLIENIDSEHRPTLRRKLMAYESIFTRHYFKQIFSLFPEKMRPEGRRTFQAYDGTNNLFNLAYEMLGWKVHRALIKAMVSGDDAFKRSATASLPLRMTASAF